MTDPDPVEEVVLLNEAGQSIGTAPKATVHTANTPLHLAFSCYVLNDRGELLVARRALSKLTWPGVWTNSFCGHPGPTESISDAIRRRARQELCTTVEDIRVLLSDFKYRATDASGVVEYEICPVHVARVSGTVAPNPDEVVEWVWADPARVAAAVEAAPFAFSPWIAKQLPPILASLTSDSTPS